MQIIDISKEGTKEKTRLENDLDGAKVTIAKLKTDLESAEERQANLEAELLLYAEKQWLHELDMVDQAPRLKLEHHGSRKASNSGDTSCLRQLEEKLAQSQQEVVQLQELTTVTTCTCIISRFTTAVFMITCSVGS